MEMAETVHVYVFNVSNKCFQLTEIATSFIKLDKRFQTMTFYKKKKDRGRVYIAVLDVQLTNKTDRKLQLER